MELKTKPHLYYFTSIKRICYYDLNKKIFTSLIPFFLIRNEFFYSSLCIEAFAFDYY